MNKFGLLAGAVGLLGLAGYIHSRQAGLLAVPEEIKAVQCEKGSRYLAPEGQDVFRMGDETLALPCQDYGAGKRMIQAWEAQEEKDPHHLRGEVSKSTSYYFKKKPDGSFARTTDSINPVPYAGETRYAVHATIGLKDPGPLRTDIYGKHWEMSVPTPPAFAATGPETVFLCQDPGIHYQMNHQCLAQARSKSLFWIIRINFGEPVKKDPVKDTYDMKPEVIEAYQKLAAHIIRQD